ncbi:unnamed protein product [Rangifer tarandus platyrhynchus]|uniref:Uncharacterized protein n=1 Tax=Rangifer tarandus platyrhynchus TaxID=3082113 RepID=A0AC59YFN3_RANTA
MTLRASPRQAPPPGPLMALPRLKLLHLPGPEPPLGSPDLGPMAPIVSVNPRSLRLPRNLLRERRLCPCTSCLTLGPETQSGLRACPAPDPEGGVAQCWAQPPPPARPQCPRGHTCRPSFRTSLFLMALAPLHPQGPKAEVRLGQAFSVSVPTVYAGPCIPGDPPVASGAGPGPQGRSETPWFSGWAPCASNPCLALPQRGVWTQKGTQSENRVKMKAESRLMPLKPRGRRGGPEPPEGRSEAWGASPSRAQQEPALARATLAFTSLDWGEPVSAM